MTLDLSPRLNGWLPFAACCGWAARFSLIPRLLWLLHDLVRSKHGVALHIHAGIWGKPVPLAEEFEPALDAIPQNIPSRWQLVPFDRHSPCPCDFRRAHEEVCRLTWQEPRRWASRRLRMSPITICFHFHRAQIVVNGPGAGVGNCELRNKARPRVRETDKRHFGWDGRRREPQPIAG